MDVLQHYNATASGDARANNSANRLKQAALLNLGIIAAAWWQGQWRKLWHQPGQVIQPRPGSLGNACCAHVPQLQAPQVFLEAIGDFLTTDAA